MENDSFDAIVVGAGPSGCSTALYLARAGKRVLLLERSRFPREKVCGDAFSGKSIGIMRELGLLHYLDSYPHGKIHGVLLSAPSGKSVTVPFPKADGMEFAGYTIARINTDNILFHSAKSHPRITAIENFLVQNVIRDKSGAACGVEGMLAKEGVPPEKKSFASRVVVGADGAASTVARCLSLQNVPTNHVYSAVRGYYDGVAGLTDNIELYFIDGVLPGYLWIFPMGKSRANVGLGILSSDLAGRKHPAAMLQEAIAKNPIFIERFRNAAPFGRISGWSIPLGSHRRKNTGDGWLLVGDAASLVDPFSGEGVGNALSSGKFAAEAICESLSSSQGGAPLNAASLSGYQKAIDSSLRPEMENSYRLQRLSRFRFLLNTLIGKAADKPEARRVIINMLASDDEKKKTESPLFFLKLFLL